MKLKVLTTAAIAITPMMLLARPGDCPFFYGTTFRGGGTIIILTAIIIIALILYYITMNSRNRNKTGEFFQSDREGFKEILNKRLAKGEITEEEYDRLIIKITG